MGGVGDKRRHEACLMRLGVTGGGVWVLLLGPPVHDVRDVHRYMHCLHNVLPIFQTSIKSCIVKNWTNIEKKNNTLRYFFVP